MSGFIPDSLPLSMSESIYSRSSSSKMIVVLLTEPAFGDKLHLPLYTYYAQRHILYILYSEFNIYGPDNVS